MFRSWVLCMLTTFSAAKHWANLQHCKSWNELGFQHPGIYHDCRSLNRIQRNHQRGKSPYRDALKNATSHLPALQPNGSWEMQGPYETVSWAGSDGHNIPLQTDGKSAYALTLGWYATGQPLWLSRAKQIILAWGNTLTTLNEQIQGGEGLAYMTAAAEIMRASSNHSGWSSADTTTYLGMIDRIIAPWNQSEGLTSDTFFMNQGFYGNGGAMNVAVFSNNRSMYDRMVYQASIGANPDPSIDYAIPLEISGSAKYYGQVTEMGRDQGHPMGTLCGLAFMGTTSHIQGSTDFYCQNDSRLLAGYEYWSRYNSGNSTVLWEPKVIRPGSGEIYSQPNNNSRGRNYAIGQQPLEAIAVAYHEYYRRGAAHRMPNCTAYMRWQGPGWDTFEWGDDDTIAHLGFL